MIGQRGCMLLIAFASGVLGGCSNSTEGRLTQTVNPTEKLKDDFFVGRITGGDLISHVFNVALDANAAAEVDVGKFRSSCSCTTAKPQVNCDEDRCTLSVTLEWRAPLFAVMEKQFVERQKVVSTGVIKVGGRVQEVELSLFGDVCSPLTVSSNPLLLNREEEFGVLEITRKELSSERFSELQINLDPGLRFVDQMRDDERIFLKIATTGSNYKGSSVKISGLSSDLVIPIVVKHGNKVRLMQDILFAERRQRAWVVSFESHGVGMRLVRASSGTVVKLQSGNDTEKWELSLPEASFIDRFCNVSLEFCGLDGEKDEVSVKVWQDVR